MSTLQSNRHHALLILLGNVLQVVAGYYGLWDVVKKLSVYFFT